MSLHQIYFCALFKPINTIWSFLLIHPKALLPTTTDHFTQTSLTLVQNQQILIIKSELTPSFMKGPESTNILATKHTSTDKHTSAPILLSYACKSFLTVQLNRWRNGKFQQLARAKIFFIVYLYTSMLIYHELLSLRQKPTKSLKPLWSPASSSGPPHPNLAPYPPSALHPLPLINAAPLRHNPRCFTCVQFDFTAYPEATTMHSLHQ